MEGIKQEDCPKHHPCPSCTGGYQAVAVECGSCNGEGGYPIQVQGGYTVSSDMAFDAGMPELEGHFVSEPNWELEACERCQGTGYRILTPEELEEVAFTLGDSSLLLPYVDNLKFNNKPVKLVPYRGGSDEKDNKRIEA
jgi:hypothetical protein